VVGFKKSEIQEARYVAVELTLKKDASNKIKGLFLGCQPIVKDHTQLVSKDEEFVWISRGDNIYMLNTDHYNIDHIDIDNRGSLTTLTAGTNQAEYIGRLKLIQKVYAEKEEVLKSGLIDPDNYVLSSKIKADLDAKIERKKETTTPAGSTWNRNNNKNRSGACNYSGYSGYSGSVYTPKKPSTTMFKRTTKYPITSAIDRMRAKIEAIKKGTYEPPKLPSIPADEEDSKKESTEAKSKEAKDKVNKQ